jgi:hypothetical protein
MYPYDEDWGPNRKRERDGEVIVNVPTIVGGQQGQCPPRGNEVSLEQAADYIMRKMDQRWGQGQWNGPGGFPGPGPFPPPGPPFPGPPWDGGQPPQFPKWRDLQYAGISLATAIPMTPIGFVPVDGLYTLTAALACKTADAGATSLVLTISYYTVGGGLTSTVVILPLTAVGEAVQVPLTLPLLGGTNVIVSSLLTGAFGAATYDAFVRFN